MDNYNKNVKSIPKMKRDKIHGKYLQNQLNHQNILLLVI